MFTRKVIEYTLYLSQSNMGWGKLNSFLDVMNILRKYEDKVNRGEWSNVIDIVGTGTDV